MRIPRPQHPRILVCGASGNGQTSYLAPALIQELEKYSVFTLDLPALFADSAVRTAEEACVQVCENVLYVCV